MKRVIASAIGASAVILRTVVPLSAGDGSADRSADETLAKAATMERSAFVNGAVRLNENADRCTLLPFDGVRQRIVDAALGEWAFFGYQSVDISKLPVRSVPGFPLPTAPRPGSEAGQRLLARIAGFWAVAPFGIMHINDQNRSWRMFPDQEWRDHWSAAFTSWVMCEAGLSQTQFPRNVAHIKYIKYAVRDLRSAFDLVTANSLPRPGDLLCASEGKVDPKYEGVDLRNLETLNGLLLHCYVVVAPGQTVTYAVGGNVVDWSQIPLGEFGSVALVIIDTKAIFSRGSTGCESSRPCWLLTLGLKTSEKASYERVPLSYVARTLLNKANATEGEK
jgi:hypothetical protein